MSFVFVYKMKTAEDLGLWEKLKNWQKIAEKLKEKLKEKSDECVRMQQNHDKLRSLISCMEREKWFLRGKYIRSESVTVPVWPVVTPDVTENNDLLVDELQRECQELRERVKELVGRLSRQDNERYDEKNRLSTIAFEVCRLFFEKLRGHCRS